MRMTALVGAGGHTRSLLNIVELNGIDVYGIYDDSYDSLRREEICGVELKGAITDIPTDSAVILSMGDNQRRGKLYQEFGGRLYDENIIHPGAVIEKGVIIGLANQVFAGAYVNTGAGIGEDNIINTKSVIEHEVVIGDHNHISVGAVLCGRARVGSYSFIGAGSVVIDNVSVCDHVIVGAGGVVVRDISEPGVYVGNPVERVR